MRTIYSFLTITLFTISSFAQNDKSSDKIDVHGFSKVFELEKLLTPIDIQGEIWQAHAMSSDSEYVFIVNDKEVPPIKSYRLKDGKFMGGLGSIGGGPGEFISINRSGFGVRKDKLIVQGRKYVRMYKVIAENDRLGFQVEREIKIPAELGILNKGFLLNDYELAGAAMFSPKEFVTFRIKGSEMGESKNVGAFGDYPNLHPDIPSTAYYHLYQGDSQSSHDGNILVKAYSNFPKIRVFDLSDGSFNDIELKPKNEQITKLVPDQRGKSIANGLDMFKYLSQVGVSQDLILADYQERTLERVASTSQGNVQLVPQTDRFLLVFNNEGELLAKLSPPEWFQKFTLTPDNRMVLFHPEIEDKLFMIDLNQFR